MHEIFLFIIDFIKDLLVIINIEMVNFNGVSIKYLDLVLTCVLIPILFSFLKTSFNEGNSVGDYNIISSMKNLNYSKFKPIGYKPKHAKK